MAKHYAIADIHGMHDIFNQVCDLLQPEDVVYFLGDAGDRGYDNWKTIKDIYMHSQWIYLKGNHEDMFVKGLKEIQDDWAWRDKEYGSHDVWMWNGGRDTEEGWLEDGADLSWIDKLEKLELTATYINDKGISFHMSHAGFTYKEKIETISSKELVWSRHHFFDLWNEIKFPKDICIHGHTPIEYLIKEYGIDGNFNIKNPEAKVYCNGHKIDIDNGVFYTGGTVLYDLDEMKAIQLFDRKFNQTVEC